MEILKIAAEAVPVLTLLGGVVGFAIKSCKEYKKIREAQRCQLRSEMLRIYYHNKDRKKIRQYEKENFICLYDAYRALKGNSFIVSVHKEVMSWGTET